MTKVSWFVRLSAAASLAAVIALASFAGGTASSASAATATMSGTMAMKATMSGTMAMSAATMSGTTAVKATMAATALSIAIDTLCVAPPTPTPAPATATAAATTAATSVATTAATRAATAAATRAATAAATRAATAAATKVATAIPPTATSTNVPVGQVPAYAGITVQLTPNKTGATRGGQRCVRIAVVNPGSPAAAAGLLAGDLLLGVDKTTIVGLPDVFDVIETKKSGDTLVITYQRAGAVAKTNLVLGLNPNAAVSTARATTAATVRATTAATVRATTAAIRATPAGTAAR